MDILITENQLKKLISEQPDGYVWDEKKQVYYNPSTGEEQNIFGIPLSPENNHYYEKTQDQKDTDNVMRMITEMGISLIPGIGQYMSVLYGGSYAKEEIAKGNKKWGAAIAILTALPMFSTLRQSIPLLKELGTKGMGYLATKLSNGAKLTSVEAGVIKQISNNSKVVNKTITQVSNKISPIAQEVGPLKNTYISKFGEKSYTNLMKEYLNGKITKEQFIKSLKLSEKSSLGASFVSKAGIKFASEETKNLKEIANNISGLVKGDDATKFVNLSVRGKKELYAVKYFSWEQYTWLGLADRTNKTIFLNAKYLENSTLEQIEEVLFHEASHIKDPAHVSAKLESDYMTVAKNLKNSAKALDFFSDNYLNVQSEESLSLVTNARKIYEYWFKRYKFHTVEITGNNNMVLNRLAPNTQELMGQIGPKQTKLALDNILNVARGSDKINDSGIKLLGSEGVAHMGALRAANGAAYNKFMKDLYKQVSYLETQMNLLNENVDKDIKKVKAVFKAFKFKLFRKIDDYSYYFQLPDHVKILTDESGIKEYRSTRRQDEDMIYVQVGHDGENSSVKFFKKKDGEDNMVKMDSNAGQYIMRTTSVNEKLKPFNIKIVYKGRNGQWE